MSIGPLFSVVIPTYNRRDKLLRCLRSVFVNNVRNVEVIVVDDGSTDSTGETIRQRYPEVKYYFQKNKGVSAARNTAIREARGEYIAFLDSDDTWYPDRIEIYTSIVHKLPEDVGLIFNDMDRLSAGLDSTNISYYPNYFGVNINDELSALSGKLSCCIQSQGTVIRHGNFYSRLIRGNVISPSCAIVKRSIFDKIGLFREDLAVAEDSELFLRVARSTNVAYIPVILTSLEPPGDSISLSKPQNNILKVQNTINYLAKFFNDEGDSNYRKLLKQRLANLNYSLGYHFLSSLDNKNARSCYLGTLRLQPLYWPAHLMLLGTFLPVAMFRIAHDLKKQLKNNACQ